MGDYGNAIDTTQKNDSLSNQNRLFTNPKYSDQFFGELRRLFIESKFTDVILICGANNQISNSECKLQSSEYSSPSSPSSKKTTSVITTTTTTTTTNTTLPENGTTNELSIPCHKLVLSAFSPYFLAMFSSNLIETKTNKVFMPNTDFSTLSEIINYAYCGSIDLNVNNVQNIFSLASLLQIKEIVDASCDYMITQLDYNNAIDVYNFAKSHMCNELKDKSKEFINRHITSIANTNEFLEMNDTNLICDLMSSDDLDVPAEDFILNTILKWIQFDFEKRNLHFEFLFFTCVRLSLIESNLLNDFYKNYFNLIKSSSKCQSLIENYLNLNKTNRQENENGHDHHNENGLDQHQQLQQQPGGLIRNEKKRAGMTKADYCFLIIGGNCDLDDGFYVNCFNPHNGEKYFLSRNFRDKSKYLSKGYFHIENPGVCVTDDNRIFVSGGNYVYHEYKLFNSGTSNQFRRKKSFSKSSSTSSSSPLTNMIRKHTNRTTDSQEYMSLNEERDYFSDGEEILSKETYEYDNLHDTWIRRANMLFAKANFTLCAMDNKIYSFGGITTDQDQLDIVEYYDISENKWQYFGVMPTPFIAGCVVRHEDAFYVMGGRIGVGRFNSCFMFKPDKREWFEISTMKIGRFNFGACVYDDKIYVFGGQRYLESDQSYYTREALDSVEIYDLKTKEWSLAGRMPNPLYNTGVCIYDDHFKCIYVCGTTECKFSGNTLFGFMFTSVFRLEFISEPNDAETKMKWTVVEHDVSDIKSNYRCAAARINTRKLHKCLTDIEMK